MSFEPIDWDDDDTETTDWISDRIRDAVRKTLAARDRRRRERATLKTARNYGLAARHLEKLARSNTQPAQQDPKNTTNHGSADQ